LWQQLYFGVSLAAVALLVLMVVLLSAVQLWLFVAEPLLTTGLQPERLQSSVSTEAVLLMSFVLMMIMLVYEAVVVVLSCLSKPSTYFSSSSPVCGFWCYCY
jgi:hypothetical protein